MIDYFFKCVEGEYGLVPELVAILALVIAINVVLKWFLLKLHARYKSENNLWKDCLIMALIQPLTTLVWVIAVVQAISYLWLHLKGDALPYSSHTIIVIATILAFAWFLMRWKIKVVHRLLEKSKAGQIVIDYGKVDAVNKVLTLVIYLVTALLLLEQSGSSLNTLIAFGGVSGLAIAFASQQVIANFFGGIVIYFTQPFIVGDWIQLPEKDIEGNVEEIGWYTTRIRTFTKRPIYIPNSMLSNILVSNPSRMTHRQFKRTICLRYTDLDKIPNVIKDLRRFFCSHPKIDQFLKPQIYLGELSASGIEINVNVYTEITEGPAYSDLVEECLYKIASIVTKHDAEFATNSSYSLDFPKGIPQPQKI